MLPLYRYIEKAICSSFGMLSLSMRMGQTQGLYQSLQHCMQLGHVLQLGPQRLDVLLDRIVHEPATVDGDLNSFLRTESQHPSVPAPRSPLSYFVPTNGEHSTEGFIPFPPSGLNNLIQSVSTVQPDIFFVRAEKPTDAPALVYGSSLVPRQALELAQLQGYAHASRLYEQLMQFRNWSTETARQVYQFLGSKQREYINTGNVLQLHTLSRADIGEAVSIHESTVSRLLAPHVVAVLSPQHMLVTTFPALDLACTLKEEARFDALHRLNACFKTEAETGRALSDNDISAETHLNRRTIAKYRGEGNIPHKSDRKEAYVTSPCVYQFPLTRYF